MTDLTHVHLFTSGPQSASMKSQKLVVQLDSEIVNSSADDVPLSISKCTNFNDKLLYIFTSGTTGKTMILFSRSTLKCYFFSGLPKAAVIKNSRFYFYGAGMYYMNNLGSIPNLVLYDPLPLYHSAGGIVGIGLMMVFGCTVVIRRKFSVRNFWKDCCKYNCTVSRS